MRTQDVHPPQPQASEHSHFFGPPQPHMQIALTGVLGAELMFGVMGCRRRKWVRCIRVELNSCGCYGLDRIWRDTREREGIIYAYLGAINALVGISWTGLEFE